MLASWFKSAASTVVAATASEEAMAKEVEVEQYHAPDKMLILDTITSGDAPFMALFKEQKAAFWGGNEELKFDLDAPDIAKLSPKARALFEYILAFFATADGEVLENAVANFLIEAESLPIRMAYTAQVFFESIHIDTYSAAMLAYIPDAAKREKLEMAFKTDPLIMERDAWMNRYIAPTGKVDDKMKAKRLVAFACAEGLFFMSAFMVIAWLRSCELFPIFARANELISRDEWFHVKLGIARFKHVYGSRLDEIGLTEDEIVEIVKEAVDLECKFASTLVPSALDEDKFKGLKAEDLILHIKNLGNEILNMLSITGFSWKVNPAELPPWVTWIQVQPKSSFYETPVTSYTIPVDISEDPKRDEDF